MPDLKAAAKRLRESVAMLASEIEFWGIADIASKKSTERLAQASSDNLLAAQALEAWAWQQERKAGVGPGWSDSGWLCEVDDQEYTADTPLRALLAAMEGEKNGK